MLNTTGLLRILAVAAVVAGILAARLVGWLVRHPIFTGFVVVSLIAAAAGPLWLVAWWVLAAVVLAMVGAERSHLDDDAGVTMFWAVCWLACVLVRHWILTAWLALSGVVAWKAGVAGMAAFWAWLAACGVAWRMLYPNGFERITAARTRTAWRSLTVYSWRWAKVMRHANLTQTEHAKGELVVSGSSRQRRRVPRRLRVRAGRWADIVTAELLPAQSPRDYEDQSEGLAASFGADICRVRRLPPGQHAVELVLCHGDALATPIAPFPPVPVARLDLAAVPVGVRETGEAWHLRLLDNQVLVAGATGSGKGSVIGSLVNALAPAVHEGLVVLSGLDPKGGVELSMYAPLFTNLAWEPTDMAELAEHLQVDMSGRMVGLRGKARRYTLSTAQPHHVIIVDEFAFLTMYMGDKRLRERSERALSVIATQGRAAGFTLIGLLQDPRKDVIRFRDLFTVRIALRLNEGEDICDAILGEDSYKRGALCDYIPETTPGVGYVRLDGRKEPERVRATWTDDNHLIDLADRYPAPGGVGRIIDTTATEAPASTVPDGVEWDDDDTDDSGAWAA